MKIAVHSDLHTEHSLCELANLAAADVLILAGDIGDTGSLPHFFSRVRKQAPQLAVLYILGNHDRWGMDWQAAIAAHRRIAEQYHIQLLDNEAVIIDDVLFCGTTLWTNFCLAGEFAASSLWASKNIPDFRYIYDDNQAFTVAKMLAAHEEAQRFLKNALSQAEGLRKKVVISHFVPAKALVAEKYCRSTQELIKAAYWTSDLPELYSLADVWIYGHSHDNIECQIGRTRFVSNQRGYHKIFNAYQKSSGYRPDYLLNI